MASPLVADVLDLVGEAGFLQRGHNGLAELSGRPGMVVGSRDKQDRGLDSFRGDSRPFDQCVLEEKSNAVIEKDLFIGRRTVESHLYSICQKMGVKSRLQLARLAAAEAERLARP